MRKCGGDHLQSCFWVLARWQAAHLEAPPRGPRLCPSPLSSTLPRLNSPGLPAKSGSPRPVTSDLSRRQSHALPKRQVSSAEPRACLQQPVKKQPSQPPPFLHPLPARKTVHHGKGRAFMVNVRLQFSQRLLTAALLAAGCRGRVYGTMNKPSPTTLMAWSPGGGAALSSYAPARQAAA